MSYEAVATKLAQRIEALIPFHQEILEMDDPWKLFKIRGFLCDDLSPSLAQAAWALGEAKGCYLAKHPEGEGVSQ